MYGLVIREIIHQSEFDLAKTRIHGIRKVSAEEGRATELV